MPLQKIEDWEKIDPPMEPAEIAVEPIASPFVILDRAAASQAAMSGENWQSYVLRLVGSWRSSRRDNP